MSHKTIEELAIEERRKYQREWCAKNRDKVAAKNRRYWEKKAAALIAEQSNANNDDSKN